MSEDVFEEADEKQLDNQDDELSYQPDGIMDSDQEASTVPATTPDKNATSIDNDLTFLLRTASSIGAIGTSLPMQPGKKGPKWFQRRVTNRPTASTNYRNSVTSGFGIRYR